MGHLDDRTDRGPRPTRGADGGQQRACDSERRPARGAVPTPRRHEDEPHHDRDRRHETSPSRRVGCGAPPLGQRGERRHRRGAARRPEGSDDSDDEADGDRGEDHGGVEQERYRRVAVGNRSRRHRSQPCARDRTAGGAGQPERRRLGHDRREHPTTRCSDQAEETELSGALGDDDHPHVRDHHGRDGGADHREAERRLPNRVVDARDGVLGGPDRRGEFGHNQPGGHRLAKGRDQVGRRSAPVRHDSDAVERTVRGEHRLDDIGVEDGVGIGEGRGHVEPSG